jgi:hypothetical protein
MRRTEQLTETQIFKAVEKPNGFRETAKRLRKVKAQIDPAVAAQILEELEKPGDFDKTLKKLEGVSTEANRLGLLVGTRVSQVNTKLENLRSPISKLTVQNE